MNDETRERLAKRAGRLTEILQIDEAPARAPISNAGVIAVALRGTYSEGYQAGMEAAAKMADDFDHADWIDNFGQGYNRAVRDIPAAIRQANKEQA